MKNTHEHDKLFDEICYKLNELSGQSIQKHHDTWGERLERMHADLQAAQAELEEKLKIFDNMTVHQSDVSNEVKKISEQLDQERINNSKLSADLAKSLELNLKLQYDVEETRKRANQSLTDEKRQLQLISEKLNNEQIRWKNEKKDLEDSLTNMSENLKDFETHTLQQNELIKNLTHVAEKKLIDLKMALDKKVIESQGYYSHLQQALTQVSVLRQENAALKDYIAKLTNLHNQPQQPKHSTNMVSEHL